MNPEEQDRQIANLTQVIRQSESAIAALQMLVRQSEGKLRKIQEDRRVTPLPQVPGRRSSEGLRILV